MAFISWVLPAFESKLVFILEVFRLFFYYEVKVYFSIGGFKGVSQVCA